MYRRVRSAARRSAGLLVVLLSGCAAGTTSAPPRFYTAQPYGSEAQFNPASQILNEGFDILSTRGQDRRIFRRDLAGDAGTVWRSLVHADRAYADYGWASALRNEFLPISLNYKPGAGAWMPNYELHLFGSGMVSRRMTEWYAVHGYRHSELLGAATMMSAHFLNEMMENAGRRTLSVDAATDLLVFDAAGILLWRSDRIQRAFSGRFILTNWSGQPTFNPGGGTLENSSQLFVLRGPLPHTERWRFAYLFGMSGAAGLTRVLSDGNAVTVGVGVDAIENPITDEQRGTRSATLRPKFGVYVDRKNSLMWSLTVGSPSAVSWLTVNAYPGLIRIGPLSPGVWLQLPKTGGARFGIASRYGFGLGSGSAK